MKISEKERKEIRERAKEVFDYKNAKLAMQGSRGSFIFHNYKILGVDPEKGEDQTVVHLINFVYQMGWTTAERYFRNADAADIMDAKDSMIAALNELRCLKKSSLVPSVVSAYDTSIRILKEALAKLPQRYIKL